jgi:ribonuclease HII
MAAAVILHPDRPIAGLADSKELSPKRREALYIQIVERAQAYAVGRAEVAEIDHMNILQATLLAMSRAVQALQMIPEIVWIDGNQAPRLTMPVRTLIQGDRDGGAISAASILAKVSRDREMARLAALYPDYGFERHQGYPTAAHLAALMRHGPSPVHRLSFAPVRRALAGAAL